MQHNFYDPDGMFSIEWINERSKGFIVERAYLRGECFEGSMFAQVLIPVPIVRIGLPLSAFEPGK